MVFGPMWIAASGISAHADAMSVEADNIANVNTDGFKRAAVAFNDLYETTVRQNKIGLGSQLAGVSRDFTQGSLKNTGVTNDLSFDGDGFFVVKGQIDGQREATRYVRDGHFIINEQGNLSTIHGLELQGWQVDVVGDPVTNRLGAINVKDRVLSPRATAKASVTGNLDKTDKILAAFDKDKTPTTTNLSTSITVFDSLGEGHQIGVHFRKDGETPAGSGKHQWTWYATVDGSEVIGGTKGVAYQGGTGKMVFGDDGKMESIDTTTTTWQFAGTDPAKTQTIDINMGDPTNKGGSGLLGMRQFAEPHGLGRIAQDGYASGRLRGVTYDDAGNVLGKFSNDQIAVVGRIALAKFSNNNGLSREGLSMFRETPDSGQPTIVSPRLGTATKLAPTSLEQSNVDLSREFPVMIAVERGAQANATMFKSANEMSKELANLARG